MDKQTGQMVLPHDETLLSDKKKQIITKCI